MHKRARHAAWRFTGLSAALTLLLFDAAALACGLSNVTSINTGSNWTHVRSYTPRETLHDHLQHTLPL